MQEELEVVEFGDAEEGREFTLTLRDLKLFHIINPCMKQLELYE